LRDGGRSPKQRGGRSRPTGAEGNGLHKRGTSAEGWEEAAEVARP
jgi:hypothetical protein